MNLAHNLTFSDLYNRDGLIKLDVIFLGILKEQHVTLYNRLLEARSRLLPAKEASQLIIDLGVHVEDFIAEVFGIHEALTELKSRHLALAPLYSCKRLFVQRKAAKLINAEKASQLPISEIEAKLHNLISELTENFELNFAKAVMKWLDHEQEYGEALQLASEYAAWAVHTRVGQEKHKKGILFKTPRKLNPEQLVAYETQMLDGVTVLKLSSYHTRKRYGFGLTDDGVTLTQALDEAHYCIWCHNQGKDSCSKGMKDADNGFKKNALDITLAGCPLEEKISEMHFLKSEGVPLGALATIIIDNPMCAGTGHRICNDCMKACIYQKQDAVNIPQAETRTLLDILELPWGFEIYSLLTRWNPLNFLRPLPKPDTGKKVLVAGMGPAGYTLSHHLMNDGHIVVGIEGLKIEPLPPELSGVDAMGNPVPFEPIKDCKSLFERLDERTLYGFGGVAEYGITVRWDKNFLKIIRLLLERRRQFALIGGVRFGSTLTIAKAWELGFDHIALCMGAGKPTVLDIPNGMARGVRTASDFLMSLQLTGAGKADSIANLQVRLPIIVIGGGLTAIDTATESLAYYPVQVEKFLSRYEILCATQGETVVKAGWNEEDTIIAEEFIFHAKQIRQELQKPHPQLGALLQSWGGVKMVYRKRLIDAPSYRLNHEEVEKALEESIHIAENLEPVSVELDRFQAVSAVRFKNTTDNSEITLPAKTLLVAAGTSPNTVLQREFPEEIQLHGKYFQAIDEEGNPVSPERNCKPAIANVLMSKDREGRAISFFGDLHPSFAGNVVKAMGSAKQGYPVISHMLTGQKSHPDTHFLAFINEQLRATVHKVIRLTPNIVEVVVKAPLAAQAFEPGQFYRLQNFANHAIKAKDTTLLMEGLALTGASVDKEHGLLSTIVLEMGGSSNLCSTLKQGEPVILMGPTGTPTEIEENKTVMLVGGGLGNAVLFSIGRALREKGSRVLYFAGYKKATDRYKIEEIEAASDVIIWACDEHSDFTPNRPQDRYFQGNIIQAMLAYAQGRLGEGIIPLQEVEHLIAIGSDRMMNAVGQARHGVLKPYLKAGHTAIGSINSPMQCMMKEICAACLQQHIDPVTGHVSYVYSCFNQDQALDHVSFPFLNERLKQNALQEKLTAKWIDYCLQS